MPRKAISRSTNVVFVRHGLTATTGQILPGRAKGLTLSTVGAAQAETLAQSLIGGGSRVAAVYHSPLERTRQTASPIARAFGLRMRAHKGLNECDFGDWTGRKISELAKLPEWKVVQNTPSRFRFPSGESFIEMQARICAAVEELVALHIGETIVVVSHADPIKAVLAAAVGAPLDLFQRITVSPCSVSEVAYGPTRPDVVCINSAQRGGFSQS